MVNVFKDQAEGSALFFSLSKTGAAYSVGKNFKLVEFASRDGADVLLIHPALMLLLWHLRAHFGRPVTINSAYRTRTHNRAVGGSTDSRHLYGLAADIFIKGIHPDDVAAYCESIGVGGVGRYDTFTHVDVWGSGRRWDERTVIRVGTKPTKAPSLLQRARVNVLQYIAQLVARGLPRNLPS